MAVHVGVFIGAPVSKAVGVAVVVAIGPLATLVISLLKETHLYGDY
jgi:hypothetical protein